MKGEGKRDQTSFDENKNIIWKSFMSYLVDMLRWATCQ